jgi:CheY-like chemotaxis protein
MTKNTFLDENYCKRYPGVIPGEHILLDVTDTGNGMDKETRNHIFEPFFTTKETGKGTGLGLSTVYGIIKQSNGHITVQSKPGHGTTFKIYFPVESDGLGDMKKITDIQKPTGGSETVLLVEDEDIVRQMVSTILKNFGYSVMEASNGREAIRICKRHLNNGFHLLITDVIMPGMNGRELAEKLKADFTIMKVLYISGYTDDAIVTREVLDEEFPFLQKPFTPNALAKKVREILDGQSAKL